MIRVKIYVISVKQGIWSEFVMIRVKIYVICVKIGDLGRICNDSGGIFNDSRVILNDSGEKKGLLCNI